METSHDPRLQPKGLSEIYSDFENYEHTIPKEREDFVSIKSLVGQKVFIIQIFVFYRDAKIGLNVPLLQRLELQCNTLFPL